jgi:hypothetical protein
VLFSEVFGNFIQIVHSESEFYFQRGYKTLNYFPLFNDALKIKSYHLLERDYMETEETGPHRKNKKKMNLLMNHSSVV